MLYPDESFRDIRSDTSLLLVLFYLPHTINPKMIYNIVAIFTFDLDIV